MKISKNPAQAYFTGLKAGQKQSNLDGFEASNRLFLLALNNVIDDYIADETEQAKFAKGVETEMQRLFKEEFESDIDKIELAFYKVIEIRKKWGMDR